MNGFIAILHYASPPIVGGVESTIFHHARLLAGHGFQVKVISGRGEKFHPEVDYLCIPEIDSRHPEVLAVNEALARGEISEGFYRLRDRLVSSLRESLFNSQICIVHNALTLHKNLALTAALHQISGAGDCRLVAWSHDFAWQDPLYIPGLHGGYPWDLLRTPWRGVKYVAVSEDRRAQLAGLFNVAAAAIPVITPGVDIYAFLEIGDLVQELTEKLGFLEADPLLLLPARITRRKNIEFAIRVIGALRKKKPSAHLIVTGPPGPHNPQNLTYLAELKGTGVDLGVADRVHFLYEHGEGSDPLNLPDGSVAQLYRLADALIFPSKREGFGIPVLEAGLARLPVFAADIPPVRESGGDLIHLFPLDANPEQVADQIHSKLSGDHQYLLRRRVLRQFSWQAVVTGQIIPLIQSCL